MHQSLLIVFCLNSGPHRKSQSCILDVLFCFFNGEKVQLGDDGMLLYSQAIWCENMFDFPPCWQWGLSTMHFAKNENARSWANHCQNSPLKSIWLTSGIAAWHTLDRGWSRRCVGYCILLFLSVFSFPKHVEEVSESTRRPPFKGEQLLHFGEELVFALITRNCTHQSMYWTRKWCQYR